MQVIPSKVGVTQPFYFFVLPSYWCPRSVKAKEEDGEDEGPSYEAVVEPVSMDLKEQVRVRVLDRAGVLISVLSASPVLAALF